MLRNLCYSILLFVVSACSGSREKREIAIIPQPLDMVVAEGEFELKDGVKLGVTDKSLIPAAEYFRSILTRSTPFQVEIVEGTGDITFSLGELQGFKGTRHEDSLGASSKRGSYRLKVGAEGVQVRADSYEGVIASIATLRQLLPPEIEESRELTPDVRFALPFVEIKDSPRLSWRGIHIDPARHFWTVAEVKRVLDLMALYKLNKLHWHLTDDQGWRMEIKRYPLLTEKGAWRKYNSHDRSCLNMAEQQGNPDFLLPADRLKIVEGDTLYGGFYTREDVKDVVAYAARLGIDVIPEIDMPGHFLAAIHHYPDLACSGMIGWGDVFSSPICPGKDATLEFCKNVYSEIFELFPYEYVHLGADEVEKNNWKRCPDCQKRIKTKGLKNEEELQAWFVHEMEHFFNEHGKRMIGWDEIVEGGLSETAVITWWRNWAKEGVRQALAQGNQVIMCPNEYFYFDYQQDKNSLKKILNFGTVLDELSSGKEELVLGIQANHWSEWIPSFDRLMYMMFPRAVALSELTWSTSGETRDTDFYTRLSSHFGRLSKMGINYRVPDLEGFYDVNVFTDKAHLDIHCLVPGVEIRYTTDGTTPTRKSSRYTGPMIVMETTDFIFRTFRPNGTPSDIVKTRFVKSDYAGADTSARATGEGLKAVWHDFRGDRCAGIEHAPVVGEYVVETVTIPREVHGNIGLVLSGYLDIPADGIYTFALLSDDGSMMVIDGELLIDNDGAHSPREMIAQKALKKGLHPVEFRYFDHNGGVLQLSTFDKDGKKIIWPKEWLKH